MTMDTQNSFPFYRKLCKKQLRSTEQDINVKIYRLSKITLQDNALSTVMSIIFCNRDNEL